MTEINEQQFKKLQPFEDTLLKAAHEKYLSNKDRKDIPQLMGMYEKFTGIKLKSSCSPCGSGLDWLKRLGKWYVKYKNKKNNE